MLDKVTWFGRGSRLELTGGLGMTLEAPYAYFVNSDAGAAIEPAAINLRLAIGEQAVGTSGGALPYCPQYAELSSGQRRYFLDWLTGGRRTVPVDMGYCSLFIYGLERRLLVDRQEVRDATRALLRLMGVYAKQTSPADRNVPYAVSLLWHVLVRDVALFSTADLKTLVPNFLTVNTDDALAAVLSFWATKAEPLADWLAFDVARQLPKSQRSVVAQRVGEEFMVLFCKRYREEFGPGLLLRVSKLDKYFRYRPANRHLEVSEVIAANPAGLMSQFNELAELWNGCVADLKRLSTLKANGDTETLDAWRATPAELRHTVDHPLVEAFAGLVAARTGDSGDVRVTPRDVAALIGIAPDAKLTLPVSRRIAEATSEAGYCLEPDARLTNRAYDDAEPIVLFLNLSDTPLDAAKYAAASTMLNVGFAVAAADGQADQAELSELTQQPEAAFSLNETEQRRLEALRGLRVANGVETGDLNRMLRDLNRQQQELVGRLMLALVAADGQVTKAELKTVRKVYSAMGWDKAAIDTAVATLMPTAKQFAAGDELVTVLPASAGEAGEPIPPPPAATPAFALNRAAIDAILRETQDVARLLADAMTPDTLGDVAIPPAASSWTFLPPAPAPAQPLFKLPEVSAPAVISNAVAVVGLPERYAAFYQQVIVQSSWSRGALADLSKSHGLMLSGAVETINDWSTEMHGGPLLYEDGDTITLETAYLNQN